MDEVVKLMGKLPFAFNAPLFTLYIAAFMGVWSHWRKSVTGGEIVDKFLDYLFTAQAKDSTVTLALLFAAISTAWSSGVMDGWPLLAIFNAGWSLGYAFDSKWNNGTPPATTQQVAVAKRVTVTQP